MTTRKVAGVDLGGTNVRCGAVSMEQGFRTCADARLRSLGTRDFERVTQILVEEIRRVGPVDAVGVAVAGMVDERHRQVVRAPNLDWSGVSLAQKIEDACGVPVLVLNDVNAITWGEYLALGDPAARHMLAVFFGTGVGSGYVADGRLVEGARGQALELGHVLADDSLDAPACGCGRRGCLEAFVGGLNFSRWIQGRLPYSVEHMGRLDEVARAGDERAAKILDHLAVMTARVLADAVMLLDPGVLMAGGTVWDGSPTFAARVRALVQERVPDAVRWASPQLGFAAGIAGAASFAGAFFFGQEGLS